MSNTQKETIIRWFEEVWNQGRRETIDELLRPGCVIHDGETSINGPEEFKLYFDRMRAAFSEIRVTFHEAIADGDLTCLRWSATRRHTGDGMGLPATGKEIHTTGVSIVRFKDGHFAEAWQNWDMLGVMEQIRGATTAKVYMAAP